MKRFVLDCSVTMAWCFRDEATAFTESALDLLLDGEAVVPAIWPLEVANVLLVGERRRRLSVADSIHFLELLRSLPIVLNQESAMPSMDGIMAVARMRQLSAYDAAYLELAARMNLPLATIDGHLLKACRLCGVGLLP